MATKTYYFDSYAVGEAWENNPANMVDGDEDTYAMSAFDGTVELCDGNTCTGLIGWGTISKVEIRAKIYHGYLVVEKVILRPVFSAGDGDNHSTDTTATPTWTPWFDITADTNAPAPWTWLHVDGLDCDVEADKGIAYNELLCSKIELRITYAEPLPTESVIISKEVIHLGGI